MYYQIHIEDFRQFKHKDFILGESVTVIAGKNATGKSTILGLLANSGEIKKKDGETYLGKAFRAQFGEIFNGSKNFDISQSGRFRITLTDSNQQETDYRDFRTSWQKDRFRIIPYKNIGEGRKTDAKLETPVIYLGLSRLFPIGEANAVSPKKGFSFDSDEHRNWFLAEYKNILSLADRIESVDGITLTGVERKTGTGITTDQYDYLTNSAGQDNLGQILLGVLSFRRLYEQGKYQNGLLLIDECDSTLHPSAQLRLFDLLQKQARKYSFQVVMTTHSSELLKYVCEKTYHNSKSKVNPIELYYLSKANGYLELYRNPDFSVIRRDLFVQTVAEEEKIKVYTEDAETRWFLTKLISKYQNRVVIPDLKMGCENLMNLVRNDPATFSNFLFVVDGDVTQKQLDESLLNVPLNKKNFLVLPGSVRPEQVFFDYIGSLDGHHEFFIRGKEIGFTKEYFTENGPFSQQYHGLTKDREKYKAWINNNLSHFESLELFDYWSTDNQSETASFVEKFINQYNEIAIRLGLTLITK